MGFFGWFKKKEATPAEQIASGMRKSYNFIAVREIDLGVTNDVRNTVDKIKKSVDDIYNEGKTNYINGIKKSLFTGVDSWISEEDAHFFTLFGHMGTGKSFFAAKLYDNIRSKFQNVIYYSAQQSHADTTVLKNMLYTVAYRLIESGDPGITSYLGNHTLPTEIDALTEDIFIRTFEEALCKGKYIFILDGLDEYSRDDCAVFLNALKSRKHRINPDVKIFFTGRPEAYIRTYLCAGGNRYYDIDEHSETSTEDCNEYIRTVSENKNVALSDKCRELLVEKSQYSLNYLGFFLEEHRGCGMIEDVREIDNAPSTIYGYYTKQLHKYFTEAGKLEFFRERVRPIISVIVAAKRPLTEDDICAIIGIGKTALADIVRDATPLFIKRGNRVLLYHDAMKEYFVSSSCHSDYVIHKEDGSALISLAIKRLILHGRYLTCDYVREWGHEHLAEAIENNPYDYECWDILISLFDKYSTAFSVIDKVCASILAKNAEFLETFFSELSTRELDPLKRERIFTRTLAVAFDSEVTRNNYMDVMRRLGARPSFAFYDRLVRSRYHSMIKRDFDTGAALAEEALKYASVGGTAELEKTRVMFCHDELIRCRMRDGSKVGLVIDSFERIFSAAGELREKLLYDDELTLNLSRDTSVSFGRLSAWLKICDGTVGDADERAWIAKAAAGFLGIDGIETFPLTRLAWEASLFDLRLCEDCMATEKLDSAARIRDIILPLKTLTRYAASGDLRNDPVCREYLTRTLDSYRRLIDLEDTDAMRERRTWEAVSFVETVAELYVEDSDPIMARDTAEAATQFMRSLSGAYLGAPYISYYLGYAHMLAAECIFKCGTVSEDGLSHIAEAKSAYLAASDFLGKFSETYAIAPALADAAVAYAYTEDGMHGEAIPYREAAIAALSYIIASGEEITDTVYDLFNAERIKLALNKIFAGDGKASVADAEMLLSALGELCGSYKKNGSRTAADTLPLGYICAGIYDSRLGIPDLHEKIARIGAELSSLGLLLGIGGRYGDAHRARAEAEIYERQGADADTVCEKYLAAIAEYKKYTEGKDIAEAGAAAAECYGAICAAYMAEESFAEAKKYAALELSEWQAVLNSAFTSEAMCATAESYYKYAVLLELQDDDEAESDERRGAVLGFYLSALKLATEAMTDDPSGAAASTVSSATEQLLGIIMDDYNATVELAEEAAESENADEPDGEIAYETADTESYTESVASTDSSELIAKYARRGIKLAREITPYLSPDVAAGVKNMIAYFESII